MNNKTTAYALARIGMGLDFFMHGISRIPNLQSFTNHLDTTFQKSVLPVGFVHVFAIIIPFVEAIIGTLLLTGLFTRFAIIAGTIFMFTLMFGTGLLQNWNNLGMQLGYLFYYALLLFAVQLNSLALDSVFRGKAIHKGY